MFTNHGPKHFALQRSWHCSQSQEHNTGLWMLKTEYQLAEITIRRDYQRLSAPRKRQDLVVRKLRCDKANSEKIVPVFFEAGKYATTDALIDDDEHQEAAGYNASARSACAANSSAA